MPQGEAVALWLSVSEVGMAAGLHSVACIVATSKNGPPYLVLNISENARLLWTPADTATEANQLAIGLCNALSIFCTAIAPTSATLHAP